MVSALSGEHPGTVTPLLAGGTQIAEGGNLENWAITQPGSAVHMINGGGDGACYPLDPGALPTTFEAFVARNAPDNEAVRTPLSSVLDEAE